MPDLDFAGDQRRAEKGHKEEDQRHLETDDEYADRVRAEHHRAEAWAQSVYLF